MASNSKKDLRLIDDYNNLIIQKNRIESSLQDKILTAESDEAVIKSLKDKLKQISDEKHDYELLLAR